MHEAWELSWASCITASPPAPHFSDKLIPYGEIDHTHIIYYNT